MANFVGIGTATTGAGSTTASQAATMPAGFAAGDLLICWVDRTHDYVLSSATPAGWTFLRTIIDPGTAPAAAHTDIYYRIAAGGDAAPGPFTTATATRWNIHIGAYHGVDPAAPFLAEAGQAEAGAGTTTAHSAPALTNTDAAALGVYHLAFRQVATPATVAPGAGLTERADTDAGVAGTANLVSHTADTNGPAAVGTVTYSGASSAGTALAVMWAALLKPAVVAQTVTPAAVASTAGVGLPTLLPTVLVASIPAGSTVGAPALSAGPVALAPAPVASTASVAAPTVTAGAVVLSPAVVPGGAVVAAPTLTAGPVTVTPELLASTAVVGGPAVGYVLHPQPVAATAAVGAPSLTAGPITVAPATVGSVAVVGEPFLLNGGTLLTPAPVPSVAVVGAPVLTAGPVVVNPATLQRVGPDDVGLPVLTATFLVAPQPVAATSSVGTPTLTAGPVTVAAAPVPSTAVVGAPVVTAAGPLLNPATIPSAATVGAPTVSATGPTVLVRPATVERVGDAWPAEDVFPGADLFEGGADSVGLPVLTATVTLAPQPIPSSVVVAAPALVIGPVTLAPATVEQVGPDDYPADDAYPGEDDFPGVDNIGLPRLIGSRQVLHPATVERLGPDDFPSEGGYPGADSIGRPVVAPKRKRLHAGTPTMRAGMHAGTPLLRTGLRAGTPIRRAGLRGGPLVGVG